VPGAVPELGRLWPYLEPVHPLAGGQVVSTASHEQAPVFHRSLFTAFFYTRFRPTRGNKPGFIHI
jgi:hypothetical protein